MKHICYLCAMWPPIWGNFFSVLACHLLIPDGFVQLLSFLCCTVHFIGSVLSINLMWTSRNSKEKILGNPENQTRGCWVYLSLISVLCTPPSFGKLFNALFLNISENLWEQLFVGFYSHDCRGLVCHRTL